jgi:hypothetical protein
MATIRADDADMCGFCASLNGKQHNAQSREGSMAAGFAGEEGSLDCYNWHSLTFS